MLTDSCLLYFTILYPKLMQNTKMCHFLNCFVLWACAWQNQKKLTCTPSLSSLRCSNEESLGPKPSIERTSIRLGGVFAGRTCHFCWFYHAMARWLSMYTLWITLTVGVVSMCWACDKIIIDWNGITFVLSDSRNSNHVNIKRSAEIVKNLPDWQC